MYDEAQHDAPARCETAPAGDRRDCVGEPDGVRVAVARGPITDACVLHAAEAVVLVERARLVAGGDGDTGRAAFLLSRQMDRAAATRPEARDQAAELYAAEVDGHDQDDADIGRICETCACPWSGVGDYCDDCIRGHEEAMEADAAAAAEGER